MRTLYFTLDEYRTRVLAVIAKRRSSGHDCFMAKKIDEVTRDTLCVFVAPLDRLCELDTLIDQARRTGARIETPSPEGEERMYSEKNTESVHNRCVPKKRAEFIGEWYSKLERHVCDADPGICKLFLICGPSGVGKTCAVESVLVNQVSLARPIYVFSIRPSEFVNEGATPKASDAKSTQSIEDSIAADDEQRATPAGCVGVAVRRAYEHCRRVKSGELPSRAMLVLHFDDLEDVDGFANAKAVLSGLNVLARVVAANTQNLSIVASCDSWYSKAPIVSLLRTGKGKTTKRSRATEEQFEFSVDTCIVTLPSPDAIARRIHACYPLLPYVNTAEIANRCRGNMWSALFMAEYGGIVGLGDKDDQRAPCERVLSLVTTTAQALQNRKKGTLFGQVEDAADIDYAGDVIYGNLLALVPPLAGKPKTSRDEAFVMSSLDAMSESLEFLSVGDLYGHSQRNSHYAGRDGVDIDKQFLTALETVAPCITLALRSADARNIPLNKSRLDFTATKARETKETAQQTIETVLDLRPKIDLLSRRPADGELILACEDEWQSAFEPEVKQKALHTNMQLPMDDFATVYVFAMRGLAWCRAAGLTQEESIRAVSMQRLITDRTQTPDVVAAEWKRLAEAEPDKFAPRRLAAGGTTQRKRKLTEETDKVGAVGPQVKSAKNNSLLL